uniref:uncharacterized protein LOC122588209 n=1 Tax=Erigeron canadensis TaxID=72917 RepID=UPI001CB924EA|nr:uncharacterized protein LOC122588209 [Erigeron canadensis]
MGGTGCDEKRRSLCRILSKYRVNFLSIQETKMNLSDHFRLKSLWGNFSFAYSESLATGRSGGIISMWDPQAFVMSTCFNFDQFVVVKGKWVAYNCECYMVNIYAPQGETGKVELWNELMEFMRVNIGNYMLCGDFNSVRSAEERMGTIFSVSNANHFNDFISRANLIDLAMGRHKFTRLSKDDLKASRLDRFLVNQGFMDSIKDLVLEALDDIVSDHRPLLLKQKSLDFGPIPFKFFNSWLRVEGFDEFIKQKWDNMEATESTNAFVILKNKLKSLKVELKNWKKERSLNRNKDHITNDIAGIDRQINSQGGNNLDMVNRRMALLHELQEFNFRTNMDLKQKAKVKWAVEGDENSKFFHSIIKAKRRSGYLTGARFSLDKTNVKTLASTEAVSLETPFSVDEIKNAIWSCGGNKAPGPDGFLSL